MKLPAFIVWNLATLLALGRAVAASPELPSNPSVDSFLAFAGKLDIADEKIELEAKQGDGSSAYFKLKINGKTWGAILPDNSGNLVYGEILSFNLARALGRPELCGPALLDVLEGKALVRFATAMREAKFDQAERVRNQQDILRRIRDNPEYLETVLKMWGPRPYAVDSLTTADDRFNTKEAWAGFIRVDGPQPSTKLVTLPGVPGQARECDLANQLSTIFLIDMLAGQADRFSKGNISAITQDGKVSFVTYDNGGTWDDGEFLGLYRSWVTRFDREAAQRVLALNEFLNGGESHFLSFTKKADLRKALGLETEDDYWKTFERNLAVAAKHIRQQKGDCFFRPN